MSLERLTIVSRHLKSEKMYCPDSPITTHVLDTSKGKPVPNLEVRIYHKIDHVWTLVDKSKTDDNGRCDNFRVPNPVDTGEYMIYVKTKQYFVDSKQSTFYPYIEVVFEILSPAEHYHIPILMSPFGYSTYRGS